MSWPGPMGWCSQCGQKWKHHKYTCKGCGIRLAVLVNCHGDEVTAACLDCKSSYYTECPDGSETAEERVRWIVDGYPSIWPQPDNQEMAKEIWERLCKKARLATIPSS
jgi:hypothetical protein